MTNLSYHNKDLISIKLEENIEYFEAFIKYFLFENVDELYMWVSRREFNQNYFFISEMIYKGIS